MILAEHDAGSRVRVTQTGDHLGRRGLGWGGGVGVVVGLFAPPLLASVAVGAAAGGLIGKFARHRVDSGIEKSLGDKLGPGTAVIITVVDDDDRLAAEQALAGSPAKSVAPRDRNTLSSSRRPWRRRRASSVLTARHCPSPIAVSAGRSGGRSRGR